MHKFKVKWPQHEISWLFPLCLHCHNRSSPITCFIVKDFNKFAVLRILFVPGRKEQKIRSYHEIIVTNPYLISDSELFAGSVPKRTRILIRVQIRIRLNFFKIPNNAQKFKFPLIKKPILVKFGVENVVYCFLCKLLNFSHLKGQCHEKSFQTETVGV